MTKIVRNNCWGCFGLSDKAILKFAEYNSIKLHRRKDNFGNVDFYNEKNEFYSNRPECKRDDPILVKVVEELGERASGMSAELEVVEISDDVIWEIADCDGMETIHEVHRSW